MSVSRRAVKKYGGFPASNAKKSRAIRINVKRMRKNIFLDT